MERSGLSSPGLSNRTSDDTEKSKVQQQQNSGINEADGGDDDNDGLQCKGTDLAVFQFHHPRFVLSPPLSLHFLSYHDKQTTSARTSACHAISSDDVHSAALRSLLGCVS